MKGVSFATSDTEENKSVFALEAVQSRVKAKKKKRLSKVDEEIKQKIEKKIEQQYHSENQDNQASLNNSVATSKKSKAIKQNDRKDKTSVINKKKRNTVDSLTSGA